MTSPTSSCTIAPPPRIAADTTQQLMALVMRSCRRRTTVLSQSQKTVRKTRRAITAIDVNVWWESNEERKLPSEKRAMPIRKQEGQLHGHSPKQNYELRAREKKAGEEERSESVTCPAALSVIRPSSRMPP
jgi:hypothetical protein